MHSWVVADQSTEVVWSPEHHRRAGAERGRGDEDIHSVAGVQSFPTQ